MLDILIKNGTIVDGTGSPMFRSDVGIREDKIVGVRDLGDEKREKEIDATGKLVCPGFVDVNNHSDTHWRIFSEPEFPSLVYQGITTIVGGNCGSSLAPLIGPQSIESIQKWVDLKNVNVDWQNMWEFLEKVEERRIAINFATLVGHATLRRGILGDGNRNLSPKELNFLKEVLKKAMEEGALGMSSGLVYTHARTAPVEEIIELTKIVKDFGGVYATHIREEKDELLAGVEEAILIARKSGVKLHISHLKAIGEENWPKVEEALLMIESAKRTGVDVTFDIYPYTATGSVLYTLLPEWVSEGGKKMLLSRLKDPKTREKVVSEMKSSGVDWGRIEIASSPLGKSLARRSIADIASSQEKSFEDATVDVLIASEGRVIISMEALNEDNIKKEISHLLSMVATNGEGYSLNHHKKTGELVHPRSFGTFPRVLEKYVSKEGVVTWEEAIRKMSGLPAEKFGLEKRGKIKEGYFADVLILDQSRVAGLASKENPYQYGKGVETSIVNGQFLVEGGVQKKVFPGRVIGRN